MAGHAAALALARSLGLGFMVTGLALLAAAAAALAGAAGFVAVLVGLALWCSRWGSR